MRKLVLFDIDGTLVLTGAAGLRAMNQACAGLVGHADALAGIPVAGRTDRIILSDVAARAGRTLDDTLLQELRGKSSCPGAVRRASCPESVNCSTRSTGATTCSSAC